MENNQVFEPGTAIDESRERHAGLTEKSLRGQEAATATATAPAAIPQQSSANEETPLLSASASRESESESINAAWDDNAVPPPWEGVGQFDGLPWWRTPSIYWLLPSFLLFALAFGGTIVPKINLILSLLCTQYFSDRAVKDPRFIFSPVDIAGDNPQCRTPEVQAMVSNFTLVTNLLGGILAAVTAPMLGAYSDRHGRVWIIVLTSVGSLMSEVITIIIARNPEVFSVYWLFLGYAAEGAGGSFILGMALVNAYASDFTPPEKRAVSFGLFHACLFSGIAIGPIIAAYIIRLTGNLLSIFYVSLVTHLCFVTFLALAVPESLTKERQLAARKKWAEQKPSMSSGRRRSRLLAPVRFLARLFNGEFFAALRILWPVGTGTSSALRRNLVLLAAIDTSMFGVGMGAMTVIIIYSEYTFGWDTVETSLFISVVNICRVSMLVLGLPLITRIFRRGPQSSGKQYGCDGLDLAIIRIAVFCDMLGFVGYGAAHQGWMFVAAGALASLGGMGSPTLQSALTKHVPPDRTGQLLGAIALLHALARVVAPTVFNGIYSVTVVRGLPQAVFVVLVAVFGICAVFSWFLRPKVYLDELEHSTSRPETATSRVSMNRESDDIDEQAELRV